MRSNNNPKSACDVVQEILEKNKWSENTENARQSTARAMDDMVDLMRATTACKMGMVVSPLNNNQYRGTLFTNPDNYHIQAEIKKARELEKEQPKLEKEQSKRWFSRR